MKPSTQIHNRRRLAVIGPFAFAFVLIGNSHPLAVQNTQRGGWQLQVEAGKTTRATLTIGNRCRALHQFSVEN